LKIVAIIAAYNEADIIGTVVEDLTQQGISVYFLDDGSTDGTVAAVTPFLGRGVLNIEQLTPSGHYNWERILARKAELARALDADWFIHHDADEFRESPWPGVTLADAIRQVDAAGYNAIDFASLDFWPVDGDLAPGADVRESFRYYSAHAPYDRLQIRCWKKAPDVDLVSTGGHEAQFKGRNVFPLRFLLRHYPIRGQAHGERKVFAERRPRFRSEERARGWHVQYDDVVEGAAFVRRPESLQEYDPHAVRMALTLKHRGVEALEAALDDKRNALGEARSTIIRLHHELDAANQELESRRIDLEAHKREIAGRRQELDRVAAAYAKSQVEAAADLEKRRVQVAELEAELDRRAAHIRKLDAEIEDERRQIETRNRQFEEREAEHAALAQVLELRDAEIQSWKRSVNHAVRRVHAFEDSLSWRITAPLRAIFRFFSRRHDS